MKAQLIFFAVIIAVCNAKSLKSSEISSVENLFGDFDPMEILKAVKEEIKDTCKNVTGNDEAYNSIKDKPDELLRCLLEAVDVEVITAEYLNAIETEKYDSLFTKGCQISRDVIPCVESFSKSLEICMEEDEKEIAELGLIIVKATRDFTCSRNISEIDAIFEAPDDDCIMSKRDELEACSNSTLMKYYDEDAEIAIKNVYKILTQDEGCTDLLEFEACSLDVLNQCDNKAAIDIVRDLFQSVIDQTPCNAVKKNIVRFITDNN